MEAKIAVPASRTAEEIQAAIADKVRAESDHRGKLIHVEELGPLFPELTPERIVKYLGGMDRAKQYRDVRVLVAEGGAAYLYSDAFIAPEDAEARLITLEAHEKIAARVREDSRAHTCLTLADSLAELFPDVPSGEFQMFVSTLAEDDACRDIRRLMGPTGLVYLYCEKHMTHGYANLLARIETHDPYATIAETVREESRIYPRPTKVELFYAPVFQIPVGQIKAVVENLMKQEEYQDIKRIIAPTAAIYLYSTRFMDPKQAERWVQWEEVERINNP